MCMTFHHIFTLPNPPPFLHLIYLVHFLTWRLNNIPIDLWQFYPAIHSTNFWSQTFPFLWKVWVNCLCVFVYLAHTKYVTNINHIIYLITWYNTCRLILISTSLTYGIHKHRWFSGRMLACHAGGPGSIPGRCIFYFSFSLFYLTLLLKRN